MPSQSNHQQTRPSQPKRTTPQADTAQTQATEELVDPRWLIKALLLTALAAVVCAWLALCGLYYLGSWQLVLRPSRVVDTTPASAGIGFDEVRFDATETGQPRLTGWWIPAQAGAARSQITVLYLHDGRGSLSATVPTLTVLHAAGVTVFAVDYRGFGRSDASGHASSATMHEDAEESLRYLTEVRHVPETEIVPYGVGLGATLAATLAAGHPELHAVVLDNPDPDPETTAVGAHPSGVVPIRLLYHEHFEVAPVLAHLMTPKLLIAGGLNTDGARENAGKLDSLFRQAASPRLIEELPKSADAGSSTEMLTRFLDQYVRGGGR
jgi:pimeloyl-ACP methyl ester carboxylesterase